MKKYLNRGPLLSLLISLLVYLVPLFYPFLYIPLIKQWWFGGIGEMISRP